MDAVRLRNMAFLLSLGGLPPGCFSDGGPSTSGAGTGGTGSTGGSTGGTTDDSGTSSSTTGTSTGVSPTSGTTADPTTTTTGTTDAVTTTGTTEASMTTESSGTTTDAMPVDPVCYPYATTIVACEPGSFVYDEIVEYCNNLIVNGATLHGPPCAVAMEEWFACIAALNCRQVEAEFTNPTLCVEQEEVIAKDCPGIDW